MENNIHPVRDFDLESKESIEWNDAIDEDNHYCFTLNTKKTFMDSMESRFNSGEALIILVDGKSKSPVILMNKDVLNKEDFETAIITYRKWQKEWNKN